MESIARAAGITKRSLYARYADKRAVFADVIPWALARYTGEEDVEDVDHEDVEAALLALGRAALTRATHPENVRLKRIASTEANSFPEFNLSAESRMWAGRQRTAVKLIQRFVERGDIATDDVELAAEHFLAMVEAVPARMADFGVFRSKQQQERHLRYAVRLFLRGVLTGSPGNRRGLRGPARDPTRWPSYRHRVQGDP